MTIAQRLADAGMEVRQLAIKIAGIRTQFPYSPHEPSSAQKFDRLWPSIQQEYLARAARVFSALPERKP